MLITILYIQRFHVNIIILHQLHTYNSETEAQKDGKYLGKTKLILKIKLFFN